MKLIAFLSVWKEEENLPEIVEQVHEHVDKIVIVDGRYKNFPGKNYCSITTETMNTLTDITDIITFVLPDRCWKSEMEKRSVMFEHGNIGDWFIVIDGDERIRDYNWVPCSHGFAELKHFLEHGVDPRTIILGAMLYDYKTGLRWHNPRLIRYIPNAHYAGNHYTLQFWDTVEKYVEDSEGTGYEIFDYQEVYYDMVSDGSRREDVDFLEFDHLDRKELDPERNRARQVYYESRMDEEPNLYSVGKKRYLRRLDRWTKEPIEKETRQRVMDRLGLTKEDLK